MKKYLWLALVAMVGVGVLYASCRRPARPTTKRMQKS